MTGGALGRYLTPRGAAAAIPTSSIESSLTTHKRHDRPTSHPSDYLGDLSA